jgi:hypothetical protein
VASLSVPSELRRAAAEELREVALPGSVRWIREVLALPEGSPTLASGPYFNATFTGRSHPFAARGFSNHG